MTLDFKSAAGKGLETGPIAWEPQFDDLESDPLRVKHLIAKLVREAVRDFHLRENQPVNRTLSLEDIEKGMAVGKFMRSREESQRVEVDEAIGQAQQGFEDGLFLLFVDDMEKKSLEELVVLAPETTITIIRLTALAGS